MAKKVLINVHGNLPEPNRPVVGNGLRAAELGRALTERGHHVKYLAQHRFYESAPPPADQLTFRDQTDFLGLIQAERPDLLICIQGEGLELLSETGLAVPVLADWIAPRLLEFEFQGLPLEQWLSRMVATIRRADYHVCCTTEQRAYFYLLLQLAGADLEHCRVEVVPLSTTLEFQDRLPHADGPVFVAGGVFWPWIRSERFLRLAVEEMERAGKGTLKIFGGRYPFAIDSQVYQRPGEGLPVSPRVVQLDMMPYHRLMWEYLATDVAIDLFEENPERQLALSFREIDYLKAGLPLICTPFSHIAGQVREYGAGWVLPELSDRTVRELFRTILAMDNIPARYSEAARRLVRERFDMSKNIQPVLDLLEAPTKATYRPGLLPAAFAWAEHARVENEKLAAERRALGEALEERSRVVESYRSLAEEKDRHLAEAQGSQSQLKEYIAAKEKDLANCVRLIEEKDRALGYQEAELQRLRADFAQQGDLHRQQIEEERRNRQDLQNRFDALAREKVGLEHVLRDIQSRFLYRMYKKIFRK